MLFCVHVSVCACRNRAMRTYLSCKHGKVAVLMPSQNNEFGMRNVPQSLPDCGCKLPHTATGKAAARLPPGDVLVGSVDCDSHPVLLLPPLPPATADPPSAKASSAPRKPDAPVLVRHDRMLVSGDDAWEQRFFLSSLITGCMPPLPLEFSGPRHPVSGECGLRCCCCCCF